MTRSHLVACGLTVVLALGVVWRVSAYDGQAPMALAVESSAAELRLNDSVVTTLHRTSGRSPRPGEDWVTVQDSTGAELARVVPSDAVPDARMVHVQEAVATRDLLVVSVYVGDDRDRHANLLLTYDLPSGQLRRTTTTDPAVCWYLAVDAASIWCLGGDAATFDQGRKDFDLLARYSRDGVRQESALRWLDAFPDVSYPVTISDAGEPSLMAVAGGVRAWLPKAGSLVAWTPGRPPHVTAMPAGLRATLRRHGPQASDVGSGVVVTTVDGDAESARGLTMWHDAAGSVIATGATMPAGTRVVGAEGDRLLVWDRPASRLQWRDAPWLSAGRH